ncbi:MAG: Rieske 2Fe-2S domain-containing protein [Candidatus Omnitrophica bacterium]|nr:Rieske 2Fe-2S domain-containing protein [Candidatus Omnitrophota bacterium]
MGSLIKACSAAEVPAGECRTVEVSGRQLGLFNVDGKIYCLDNTCPHQGGPLGEGSLEGSVVTCPWHGWQFDVTTGVSPVNPAAQAETVACKIEGGSILVEL